MPSPPPPATYPAVRELPRTIDTARLRLRPFSLEDAEAMFALTQDPELPRYMSWAAHTSVADSRAYLASVIDSETNLVWAITTHAGALVGAVALGGVRREFIAWRVDRAELGYWIGIPHQKQGFMMEAAAAVVDWAFTTLQLHKLTVSCLEENKPSQKVIQRLGFRFVGTALDDVWRDGAWHAQRRYELLASAYGDIASTLEMQL